MLLLWLNNRRTVVVVWWWSSSSSSLLLIESVNRERREKRTHRTNTARFDLKSEYCYRNVPIVVRWCSVSSVRQRWMCNILDHAFNNISNQLQTHTHTVSSKIFGKFWYFISFSFFIWFILGDFQIENCSIRDCVRMSVWISVQRSMYSDTKYFMIIVHHQIVSAYM